MTDIPPIEEQHPPATNLSLSARPLTHVLDEAHAQLAGSIIASIVKVLGASAVLVLLLVFGRPWHGGILIAGGLTMAYVAVEVGIVLIVGRVRQHVEQSLFVEWLRMSLSSDDDVAKASVKRRPPDSPVPSATVSATPVPSATVSATPVPSATVSATPAAPSKAGTAPAAPSKAGTAPAAPSKAGTAPAGIKIRRALKAALLRSKAKVSRPAEEPPSTKQKEQEDVEMKGKKR